ncbi:MAG: DUF2231 domain-containing protein [Proteobacteria bacterium]|nr:DUF2231 domain-containing protein [Pseudomonadota bacterium]
MKPIRVHGLPLHPVFVHFPVAAWTVATGLALLAPLEIAKEAPRLALYANAFGLLAGVVAMTAGFLELVSLPSDKTLRDAIARHMTLAVSAWFAYLVMWVLQMKSLAFAAAVAGMIGFVLLLAAGHAGAQIVYRHGFPGRQESQ